MVNVNLVKQEVGSCKCHFRRVNVYLGKGRKERSMNDLAPFWGDKKCKRGREVSKTWGKFTLQT